MIKRTTKKYMEDLLEINYDWNVLDLACGRSAGWTAANTLSDHKDYSDSYPDKRFICCDASNTPFKHQEFDFVVASHITEHVDDVGIFLTELMRISKRGYIEVPTPLFDNLVYGNPVGHLWWITFDDAEEKLICTPRIDVVNEMIHIPELNLLYPFFRESIVTELYWENSIEWKMIHRDRIFSTKKWLLGSR